MRRQKERLPIIIYPYSPLLKLYYCITCWGNASNTKSLFLLQKRAVRAVGKEQWLAHSSPIFKQFKILKFDDIYRLHVCKVMYKINQNTWLGNVTAQPINSVHNYSTRLSSSYNYWLPRFCTNIGKNSFLYMGPFEWSNLPSYLKDLPFKLFVKTLTDIIIESY